MVGEEKFRKAMGHFATGVTVVTARDGDGRPVGLTVNAFTSVSLDPPLILVCIHKKAESHEPILESGFFAVNILSRDQETLAITFARGEASKRFENLEIFDGPKGCPLLPGVLAWLECRVHRVYPGGDHSIIVAEVLECEGLGGEALGFLRGELGGVGP